MISNFPLIDPFHKLKVGFCYLYPIKVHINNSVCVCVRVCGERDTERETERQKDTEREVAGVRD